MSTPPPPTSPFFTQTPAEAAAATARATAARAKAAAAAETATQLAALAAQEADAVATGDTALTLAAAPLGAPGVTAPVRVATPAVAAVGVGLGFYVEANSLAEAAALAAERAKDLGSRGGE